MSKAKKKNSAAKRTRYVPPPAPFQYLPVIIVISLFQIGIQALTIWIRP